MRLRPSWPRLLGRLRQNCLNPGGGGCSEPRSCTAFQPGRQTLIQVGQQSETLSQKKKKKSDLSRRPE
uniref:Uncharacterized protein n=1 Tax=Astyanax mexicanus TaxID=7994 RepID=A0A3B1ISS0_ASTMX